MTIDDHLLLTPPKEGPSNLKWNISAKDRELLLELCTMVWDKELAKSYKSIRDLALDLMCTHCNGNPLDFSKLLSWAESPKPMTKMNTLHDILGIRDHLDRTTGVLLHFFVPRGSKAAS